MDETRRALLVAHLQEAARTPFAWGGADCLAFVADWVHAARGVDLLQGWRGTAEDEPQARAMLARHGGLALVFRTLCRRAGLQRVPARAAQPGDIGLTSLLTAAGQRLACGLCVPGGVAFRTADGFAVDQLKFRSVFRV